ncbi:transcription termination factor 1-like [Oscarella lobularis]|uniref:transcription termination factor 1-like n=1 Tax=Oscarella lobularis TaxID=121494 RepID=UPI0033144118
MTDSSATKKKKKKTGRERPPSEEDFALETKKRRKRLHSGGKDEDEVRKKRRRSEEAKENESESHSKIEKKKKKRPLEDGQDRSEDKARQKRKKKKKRKRRQNQGEPYLEIETATVDQSEKKKRRKHLHSNGDDKQPSIRDENESETEKKEKEARETSPLDREDERRHLDIEECSEDETIYDETRQKRKKKKKKKRRRQQDEDEPHAEIETTERGRMIIDQEQPEDEIRQQLVREEEEGNRARKEGFHLGRDAAIVIERMANTDAFDDDDVLESEDEYAAIHQTTTSIIPPVEGVDRQKGEFTRKELDQMYHNIYRFCNQYQIGDPTEIILQNRRDKNGKYSNELRKDFFQAAARHVPRTLHSIYRRLRRQFDEKHYGGRFTIDENRELASLKEKYGTDWGLIGEMMGRSGQSCLDRSRVQRGRRGMWSNEEEEALVVALREIADERDDDLTTMSDKGLPWKAVSERVATRNFNQCRQKWLQNLRTIIVDRPERFRFVASDRARLIERVYEQYANEGTARCDDIRWEEMGRSWEGGPVSRAILRRHWSNIVRLMPNYEVKSFEERVEYAYETTLPSIAAPRVLQNKESTT